MDSPNNWKLVRYAGMLENGIFDDNEEPRFFFIILLVFNKKVLHPKMSDNFLALVRMI